MEDVVHPMDAMSKMQISAVVEQVRQQGRKGSQHLAKRRRGNVPLKAWPIPAVTVSVADTVAYLPDGEPSRWRS